MTPLRLAVLVSGTGRSLRNLLELQAQGRLAAQVVLVVSSRADAPALGHARDFDVPCRVLSPDKVTAALDEADVELVVLAGYVKRWPLPERFVGRAINIHPALLPRHGGKGFYGRRVHEAVLACGEEESGCTVHYVTTDYDAGPIIDQERVKVLPGDDPGTLAERVFERELALLPRTINALAAGRIRWEDGRAVHVEEC